MGYTLTDLLANKDNLLRRATDVFGKSECADGVMNLIKVRVKLDTSEPWDENGARLAYMTLTFRFATLKDATIAYNKIRVAQYDLANQQQ